MRIIAIVQARLNSTRFPKKILKPIGRSTVIEVLLKRLSKSKLINKIIVAISDNKKNVELVKFLSKKKYEIFLGSDDNLLKRYSDAADRFKADIIIRVTADCPLIDSKVVDEMIKIFLNDDLDVLTNYNPPTFPDGLDVAIFKNKILSEANRKAKKKNEREHVLPYMLNSKKFKIGNYSNNINYSQQRWTIDELDDYEVIKNIFNNFSPDILFGWHKILELSNLKPELFYANRHLIRDEGFNMSEGQKLWKRAKKIIPNGNMLLSKNSDLFLPNFWPSYFSKSKGCEVWDLEGNKFLDLTIMGIGTNILGYAHNEVDEKVMQVIRNGNMSTLNAPEEVYLAEKMLELNPWADMAKFARTGGEANAIAVRIARAATTKQNIAICGYHGWHDWYLSANLENENQLNSHLFPNLKTKGVLSKLKNTIFPFEFNNIDSLVKILEINKDIGIIKMEVMRNHYPKSSFLKNIREIANKKNLILIFDECTTGFRETNSGLYKKYNVVPDLTIFGKALGNGYAITSVVGKKEIMKEAENTFISSTFWSEKIGYVAGLKTLEIMNRDKTWEKITRIGEAVQKNIKFLAQKNNLKISVLGLPSLTSFFFNSKNHLKYKTYLTQEMLKKNFLASNVIYISIAHTKDVLKEYYYNLDKIFKIIKECEDGRDIDKLLDGPVCAEGMRKLI